MPLHWGFIGRGQKGLRANVLTPFVGDANTQTPEFKAFLVNIEPIDRRRWREGERAMAASSSLSTSSAARPSTEPPPHAARARRSRWRS